MLIQTLIVSDEVHDIFVIYKLYKFDTLNIPSFRNRQDIITKRRERVALTIEFKLKVCKMVKNIILKSFITEQ